MLPVFPVYALAICVSKSTHAGALPSPTYPYFDNHRSTEVHTVAWLPGPWVVKTGRVFGDANVMILDGHDTGMMIPHLSPVMDNLLLPLTMLTSSCSWPFASFRKTSKGKGIVGFFSAYAPFVFCDAQVPDKPDKAASSSDRVQALAARKNKAKSALAKPPKKLPGQGKLQSRLDAFGAKTGFRLNLGGRGRICIPTALTVRMELSFGELLFGWGKFLVSRSIDALFGVMLRPVTAGKKNLLADRFDNSVARKFAERSITRVPKTEAAREFQRGVARLARKEIYEAVAVEAGYKAMSDGVLKAIVIEGKVKVPYGLFSYSIADEKGSVLWWGAFEGVPSPIEFKGIRGLATEALKDMCYQPSVAELVADNPNYAAVPKEPD